MNDSRLQQIEGLLDDARCLASDIEEELPTGWDLEFQKLRAQVNDAIRTVQRIKSPA